MINCKRQRKSIRLPEYDYSKNGWYFVTICTQNKECLFGNIVDGKIRLNNVGKIINRWWSKLTERFNNVQLDKWQTMSNHLHGIIIITRRRGDPMWSPVTNSIRSPVTNSIRSPVANPCSYNNNDGRAHGHMNGRAHGHMNGRAHGHMNGRAHGPAPTTITLGNIVGWFKTMSTNQYIRNVKIKNWPPFNKRLWQRNYYEHIIRNEKSLQQIREYIQLNPLKWEEDKNNPKNFEIKYVKTNLPE